MAQNALGGFLKGLFGRQTPTPPVSRPQAETRALGASERVEGSDVPTQPLPQPTQEPLSNRNTRKATPLPTSEAYLNRKKGRKTFEDSYADARKLYEGIQRRGEASPGQLAQESGMARSSLTYHLNRMAKHGYIERMGGGRSIRYKVTGVPLGRID